jgi:hypothetical protein
MRDKRLATAVATLLAAFATAHLMQFGLSAGALLSGKGEAAPIGLATLVARPYGGEAVTADPPRPPAPIARALPPDNPAFAPDRLRDSARSCARSLTARPGPGAVIRAELRAPCDPGARVEIAHAGLRFAMATSGDGRLLAEVPAMRTDATVAARFADGSILETRVAIPEANGLERVAVVFAGGAGLTLHAFESGAERGSTGHVHAGGAGRRAGAMVRLGDAHVEAPLIAQVYSQPAGRFGALGGVRFELEAVVTPANCARDVTAEFVRSGTGTAPLRLGLSIPSCAAAGELLVLPLPATDLRLARN